MTVAVINSGCANIASVQFAIERLGKAVTVTEDPREISRATHVVLPGVGSFDFALTQLKSKGLLDTLAALNQPVLGICLGMQAYFDGSEEGKLAGLGLIKGQAKQFVAAKDLTVPHMGWNELIDLISDPLLLGITEGDYVYFVHSYYQAPSPYTIASCQHGVKFSAIVRRDNFWGCQFHPERSGDVGAKILDNFLRLS